MVTLNDARNESILNEILEKEMTVYEDVQGSKIWVNYDGDGFTVRPRRLTEEPINMVDLAMQNYYNGAVSFFERLDDRVKVLLPRKWWFCFEWFPDEQPANLSYSKIPLNGLVLVSINKNGKYVHNVEELIEYANLFNVDHLPVIFQGVLSDEKKKAIRYFLATSEEDLEYVFGDSNFAFFFYKLLDPYKDSSFLMDGEFQDNMEKIIIQVGDHKESFQILNPMYKRMSVENSTEFTEVYTLILVNFLTFCQNYNISELKPSGETKDELYISLICLLFNDYVSISGQDLINFEFTVPEFFSKEKFKINKELIKDKKTSTIIDYSPKLEYIFKIILSSFNKKRKKPIGVFTEGTVTLFNSFVDEIGTKMDIRLKKLREQQMSKTGLVDFSQWFEIEYDKDGDGQVYPSIWDEITSSPEKKKKKEPINKKTIETDGDVGI
jgi:hypothetical protein